MVMPGLGLKLLLTGSSLTTGIAVLTGAATGGAHQSALSTRPDTVAALCRYATTPRTGTRTTAPQLSPDQAAELRSQELMAAAENLPKDKAISTIVTTLRNADHSSDHQPPRRVSARDLRALVTAQFNATAADYCEKLTASDEDETGFIDNLGGSSRGEIAVRAAMKMLGVPYAWGGGGPAGPSRGIAHGARTVGFDCSGLTEYAWSQAGVRIGGTTDPQWRSGPRVPRSGLLPGDLLFFAHDPSNPATIHHVGINIDGKRMIHSPQTGRSVEITRWSGVPYREREFIGAVRPRAR